MFSASVIRAMMMEAASISQTLGSFCQTMQSNSPEDSHIHIT
jgi:hypothetical protein